MLSSLSVLNFKCFQSAAIPLRGVTVLSGVNGSGKSTILQALLLVHQTLVYSPSSESLLLNGDSLGLGRFIDVKNDDAAKTDPLRLQFAFSSPAGAATVGYDLEEHPGDERVAQIARVTMQVERGSRPTERLEWPEIPSARRRSRALAAQWQGLIPSTRRIAATARDVRALTTFDRLRYISAERLGPRDYHLKRNVVGLTDVGPRGEYTGSVLAQRAHQRVGEHLRIEGLWTPTLEDQAEAWLQRILGGGRVRTFDTDSDIVMVRLASSAGTSVHKPANAGFGYSHALPILVSGLLARAGDILVVENPEAHLHPASQSEIAVFLAKVSSGGVQVLIETHSDHVLNALRLQVKQGLLLPSDVAVLFFHKGQSRAVEEIPFDESGRIERWPAGFFDQFNRDLSRLFDI